MASAIPFISYNERSKQFEVNSQGAAVLGKVTGPVAVLAVAGRARQGKSWLLNQLIAKLGKAGKSGFTVGPTQKPCTKGLWLWSDPVARTTPTGLKYHLVFLDCEGIDAFDQSKDYSTQVFSLGVLLSSMLIYNQLGSIDESSVEALSTVCEFAKLIRAKSGAAGGRDLSALSPGFLWLLRDFHLQLQDNGKQLTPEDYMEEVLALTGHPAKDQIRTSIKELFPERDCAALVRPLNDERALANMDTLPLSQLRPEFRQGLEALVSNAIGRATPKAFHGSYLTGRALVSFAQAYVGVLNKGEVPSLSSTWQAVLASENQKALDAALSTYAARMDAAASSAGSDAEDLDVQHEAALVHALQVLEQQSLGDAAQQAEYAAKLRAAAAQRYQPLKAARVAQADAHASQLLSAGAMKLTPLMSSDPPDLEGLDKELTTLLDDYDRKSTGPTKYRRAAEFLVNTVVAGTVTAARRAYATLDTARARVTSLEKELSQAKQELSSSSQKLGSAQHTESVLKARVAELEASLTAARKASEQRAAELAVQAAGREAEAAQVQQLQRKLDSLQSQLTTAKQEAAAVGAAQTATADAKRHAEGQVAQLRLQITQLQGEVAAAKQAAASAAETARREATTSKQQADDQVRQLRGELEVVRAQLTAARGELAGASAAQQAAATAKQHSEEQLNQLRAQMASLQSRLSAAQQEAAAAAQQAAQANTAATQQAEQQLSQVRAEVQLLQARVTTAHQERDAARSEAQAAVAAADAARVHNQAHNTQVSGLQSELDMVRASGREAEAKAAMLEAQVQRLQLVNARQQPAGAGQGAAAGPTTIAVVTAQDEDMADVADEAAGVAASSGRGRKRLRAVRAAEDQPAPAPAAAAAAAAAARTPVQARVDAAEDGAGTPFSDERQVVDVGPRSGARTGGRAAGTSRGAAAAAAAEVAPADDPNGFNKMTVSGPLHIAVAGPNGPMDPLQVAELKSWLTDAGHEADVHTLATRKPAPKKDAWVKLAQSKAT